MGLLDKLKSLLGGGDGRQPQRAQPQGRGQGANVTVEREPATESEAAVKEASTGTETGSDAGEADETAEEPVEDIKGIGTTYAGRLNEAGIETVADLAAADAADVADVAQASETKAQGWIDRANER